MSFISLLFYHPVIIKAGHTDTLKLCNLNEYRCLYNALLIHFTRLVIHRYCSVRVGESEIFGRQGVRLEWFSEICCVRYDWRGGWNLEIWQLWKEFISIRVKVWILVFRFIEYNMFGAISLSFKSNVISIFSYTQFCLEILFRIA